jgi:hypothetical protein
MYTNDNVGKHFAKRCCKCNPSLTKAMVDGIVAESCGCVAEKWRKKEHRCQGVADAVVFL